MGSNISMPAYPSLPHRATFAAATFLAGFSFWRALTPPTPPKARQDVRDFISSPLSYWLLSCYRNGFFAITVWQALIALSPPPYSTSPFTPAPRSGFPLNPVLLTWNPVSAVVLPTLIGSAMARLFVMGELGKDFTFDLRNPDKLNTSGTYRYVQHPSYSAGFIAFVGGAFWFLRCDGVGATIFPEWVMRTQGLWNWLLPGCITAFLAWGATKRVSDEEAMLKNKFGKEWEDWNKRTARFIPFLW